MAANVTLQTIDVTPATKTISVGQKQTFTATGTFSDGSKHALGPAIGNIAAGYDTTCALLTSGGVECWGEGDYGELGDGTTDNSLTPRAVEGISTATAIGLEEATGCALLASGSVQCWGWNLYGQLGNGSSCCQSTIPVPVTGISTATALSSGDLFSCALLAGGSIQCWGSNYAGALGNGSDTDFSSVPVPVTGISTAIALSSGGHNCALLASGAVQCWGLNRYGQLGDGTTTNSNTPVTVHGISNPTAIAVAGDTSCALFASGVVECWGGNVYGELGNGSHADHSTVPVPVTGISTAVAISAGAMHVCAVLRGGSVECWGTNSEGQLGVPGSALYVRTPVRTRNIYAPTRLAGGWHHTCALFSGGVMRCWGESEYGELGNRKTTGISLAVTVIGTPGVVWTSSDTSKATITDRGVAKGLAAGNATVTATTAGFINDNAVLTVK